MRSSAADLDVLACAIHDNVPVGLPDPDVRHVAFLLLAIEHADRNVDRIHGQNVARWNIVGCVGRDWYCGGSAGRHAVVDLRADNGRRCARRVGPSIPKSVARDRDPQPERFADDDADAHELASHL